MARDPHTPDLLDWKPKVQPRPRQAAPEGNGVAVAIKLAIAEALRHDVRSRDQIAEELSAFLGERVTKDMVDKYASLASENHLITAHRLAGLARVLKAPQLVEVLARACGCIVVDERHKEAIEYAYLVDDVEYATRRKKELARKVFGR